MSEPIEMGLFPLDMVLLPGEPAGLHIFEPRYRQLFADCTLEDQPFVLVRSAGERQAPVGCSARFESVDRRFEDGRLAVTVRGIAPVSVGEESEGNLYFSAMVTPLDDELEAEHQDLLEEAAEAYRDFAEDAVGERREPPRPADVAASYAMAGTLDLAGEPKQELLEMRRESDRLRRLVRILRDAAESAHRARIAAERAPTNGKVSH
jgi:Lon protease-like protein